MSEQLNITEKDRQMPEKFVECPMCSYARRKQKGLIFWILKRIESRICPYCKAYERVYGRKAHEPMQDLKKTTRAPI